MVRRVTIDFDEDVIGQKPYLSRFAWTSNASIMQFYCLTPATSARQMQTGVVFSPRIVLKTFVEELEAMEGAVLFVNSARWDVVSGYLKSLGLPVPENRIYKMDLEDE